jgi:Histidine kinase
MRWLLSIWRVRRPPPTLRELPILLLKAAIFGAITGPFLAIFFTAIFDPHSLPELFHPAFAFGPPGGPAWLTDLHLMLARVPLILGLAPLEGIVWTLCFFVACGPGNWYLRARLNGYPPAIIGWVHIVYNFIACSLAFALANEIIKILFGEELMPYFWRVVLIDGILGAILALVIGAFVKLKVQVERTQTALGEKEVQQTQLVAETARAQSMALQSQINPHFFFNTLNSISALIEIDPTAAQRMIGRLSDMFRYTLGCTHSGPVPLEQEVQFVRDYLAIEQARFQRRLRVELPASGLTDIPVPGLVLQPLVENAVKYGIAERLDGGTVSVNVERNGRTARISVRNTASGRTGLAEEDLFRPGHALENVRARLRLFTGDPNPLRFRSDENWVEFSFDLEAAKS